MNDNAAQLEIEVKFHLPDPEAMADRLTAMGARARPVHFETNLCFDDADRHLFRSGRLLRLRRDDQCRLTYKERPDPATDQFKVVNELEVTVDDFDTMRTILHRLGYHTARTYEKWRQTFEWQQLHFCLDNLPFGHFLEIEAPGADIRSAARALDLPWSERIIKNYLAIFEILRSGMNLPFSDVTFDLFKHHPVDLTSYLPLLQVTTRHGTPDVQ
ncbi:class IV adenylate cyclase [Desulfatitalea alkaliphila]|uniref:Class IV adenylate cyclase n=1 Tax=Desulfatitalea alkaliphila TaxID=2929485 RepID=A0AA41R2L7_9BACT|nr:class IV adenylate cyclase [Desulfatitalea alkaliphila]MCJ8500526.1 class IV adenylate cyclase [Desulfatitalea alkaliphila]